MARKPLLGSPVLNREGVQSRLAGDDLMSRVIENDAVKHGRASPTPGAAEGPAPEAPETAPEPEDAHSVNKSINQVDNKFNSQQISNIVNKAAGEGDDPQAGPRGARRGVNKGGGPGQAAAAQDPLTRAYLATLSQPFPPADARAPRVLVAGRVRPEVSERFELACTLLKKRGDKQDVLNRALQVFIEHVVAHGGDIEI